MRLKIIFDDSRIIKDGVPLVVDLSSLAIDVSNLWAIAWDDQLATPGEMELRDPSQRNITFDDMASIQPFVDLYDARAAELAAPAPLVDYQALKKTEMEQAASVLITNGFSSTALGSTHHYGGKITDQLNLIGAASADVDMAYPCADDSDVWARRQHTAAQLKQVLLDGSVYKQSVLIALDVKRNEIDIAVDHDQVDAVVW